jgi:hypothetical protein
MDEKPTFRIELTQTFGRGVLQQEYLITRPGDQRDEAYYGSLLVASREELQELQSLLQHILDTTNP